MKEFAELEKIRLDFEDVRRRVNTKKADFFKIIAFWRPDSRRCSESDSLEFSASVNSFLHFFVLEDLQTLSYISLNPSILNQYITEI